MAYSIDDGDAKLLAAAQRGEPGALDVFVRRHDRWVRGVVFSHVANPTVVDDVVQQVWTTVWRQAGTLLDTSRWRGWLYRTAKNAAIDAGKKAARQRRLRLDWEPLQSEADRRAAPDDAAIRAEDRGRMLNAIAGLPVIYREPFVLRHMQDWSYAEIGEALSLPVDTVETRLVRARRLLRDALGGPTPRSEVRNA